MFTKILDIKLAVRLQSRGVLNKTDIELFDLLVSWAGKGYRKVKVPEIADAIGWSERKVRYRLDKLEEWDVVVCGE